MKLKLYITIFIGFSLFAFSCKTASKLYEKGNYDEAVELAAKKLQKDPDDAKLLDIINNSYRYAVNDHESRIKSYSLSKNELKWEWMYNEYVSLQRMYDAIYKVPAVMEIVKPFNYTDHLIIYRQKAGDVHYDRGIAFMQRYTKKSYQDAYREFQLALHFNPGNRDATIKMEEAYEYAVTNIIILPMQQQGGYVYSSYSVGEKNLDDKLLQNLQYNSGNKFVKFYSAWDARSKQIRVDQEVEMRITNIDIGRQFETRNIRKVSKEIVVKETVYKPDSIVKEYAVVKANIITKKRNMNSYMSIQLNIRNSDGQWVWNDQLNAEYYWATEFSEFNGDARALNESDKQLINARKEFAPSNASIENILLDNLNNNTLQRIRNYANRF